MTTLNDLPIGKTATVAAVGGEGSLRQHFLDMGIIPLVDVTMVKHAPMGDPIEVRIHSYELTLRRDDARNIEIDDVRDGADVRESRASGKPVPHPGLGEGGKFHDRAGENPLPEGTPLTFALVGNQNCGKTTLFNQLTGSNQHVGNFPGVTVDRKDGCIKGHPEALVTDLPGIYSMSPYSSEEVVTRRFLLDERPRGIVNIVDATNVERNLYLTMQLMELGMPMVLALNMMDEVEGNGGTIHVNEMEKLLGIPVIPISASKNEGIGELVDHALHVARFQEPPVRQDFCAPDEHDGAVHRCLHSIMALIEDHAERAGIPPRFAASKLAEGDQLVLDRLDLDQNEKDALEHIICQMEAERGLDRAAAIQRWQVDYRLLFSAFVSVFILSLGLSYRAVQWLFANRAAGFIALISYNLYIWHTTILLQCKAWHLPPYPDAAADAYAWPQSANGAPWHFAWQVQYTVLFWVASLVVAALATYLIEKPAAKWLLRRRRKREDAKAVRPA